MAYISIEFTSKNRHHSRYPGYRHLFLIACGALESPNLHRIYKNLLKFAPFFAQFTKMYVIYNVNCVCLAPSPTPIIHQLVPYSGVHTFFAVPCPNDTCAVGP